MAKSLDEVKSISDQIIDAIDHSSDSAGGVNKVLIAEDVYPGDSEPKEFYVSVLLNRSTGNNMIMYSTEGGMDIEAVAEKTPELILRKKLISPWTSKPQARNVAFNLGLSGGLLKEW